MTNRLHSLVCAVILASLIWNIGYAQRAINTSLALPVELPSGDYKLEIAWSQFNAPIAFANPPGETNRLLIAERAGRIRVITDLEQNIIQSTPVLDIRTSRSVNSNSENGLLGLAIHPDYPEDKRLFVFYCHNQLGGLRNRVSSFLITKGEPLTADPDSEVILFDQVDDAGNHNGGDLHFGPDGYLYVALGDEGGANDSHNNSQRVNRDFFSGIVRLDVNKLEGSVEPTGHAAIPRDNEGKAYYSVPADNPLVGQWQQAGADPESDLRLEFYAIGLRNPWRMAFDNATGRLWVGDVGQGAREEVDIVEKGGNYGWAFREGFIGGPKNQTAPAGFTTISDPIHDYPRGDGQSVTGGVVYRRTRLPELEGAYIFGDYGSGRVWALFEDPEGGAPNRIRLTSYSSHWEYGIDPSNGDVLISGSDGNIRRLVRGDGGEAPNFPANLSETGAFKSLATLEPEDGILAYEPNVSFWSDHAEKFRWVSVPDSPIGFRLNEPWRFPAGTIWIKHFDLPLERDNPASTVRVETRFLVKTPQSVYGISYQWNEAGTEATLVGEAGESIDYQVEVDGRRVNQTWRIPSRQECLQCHTAAAGYALSFNTRQLNREQLIDGVQQNLLTHFSETGVLDTTISDVSGLPRFSRADDSEASQLARVRSYLAVNCVSCHQPGAVASTSWDARPQVRLLDTGLINGLPLNDGGDADRRLIVPGNVELSVLVSRLRASHGFTRMPNIATHELDQSGIALITEWIDSVSTGLLTWQNDEFSDMESSEADPSSDPDFDLSDNRFEYLTGTDPLDPLSFWRPNLEVSSEGIQLRFSTVDQRTYTVLKSRDLDQWETWSVDGNPVQSGSNGGAISLIESGIELPAFLQLRVGESNQAIEQ